MPYMTAEEIDQKLPAKRLFKFMRHGCNQTVTGKEENNKTELCKRAAMLGDSLLEYNDWKNR